MAGASIDVAKNGPRSWLVAALRAKIGSDMYAGHDRRPRPSGPPAARRHERKQILRSACPVGTNVPRRTTKRCARNSRPNGCAATTARLKSSEAPRSGPSIQIWRTGLGRAPSTRPRAPTFADPLPCRRHLAGATASDPRGRPTQARRRASPVCSCSSRPYFCG